MYIITVTLSRIMISNAKTSAFDVRTTVLYVHGTRAPAIENIPRILTLLQIRFTLVSLYNESASCAFGFVLCNTWAPVGISQRSWNRKTSCFEPRDTEDTGNTGVQCCVTVDKREKRKFVNKDTTVGTVRFLTRKTRAAVVWVALAVGVRITNGEQ
jgi:hypothetical protein